MNAFGIPAEDLTERDLSLAKKIGKFYFGEDVSKVTLDDNFLNVTNFFTDAVFAHGTDRMIE